MSSYGRETVESAGRSIQLTADGKPEMKAGGACIDWSTVTAVSGADVTQEDGVVIRIGEKYLRYGQLITLMGVAEVQTVTETGGPTAGAYTLTLPAAGDEPAQTTAPITVAGTAAVFQAALLALSRIGPNGATVARTGAGTAGDPYIYTITFNRDVGNVPQLTSTVTTTLTGGTTPSISHATSTPGTGGGKYGPYDPDATDGRQTMARGQAYLLNATLKELDAQSDYGQAMEGGLVFKDRLLATNGTHTLAAGPTHTEISTLFPRLRYVAD